MEFSKKQIQETMDQYLQDNEDYGDDDESKLIIEVFNGFKKLILEGSGKTVSSTILQEHSNKLNLIPKEIFDDWILYLNMTELDSRLI